MSPWQLELLRLVRTRTLVALVAVFLILGFGGPVLVHYLPELVKGSSTNGVKLVLPTPKPVDGIQNFGNNISTLGTLVVVLVAAASLSVDANPALAIFYRTRVHSAAGLLLPRFVAVVVASVVALALGTVGAWYETSVLIGRLSFGPLAVGFLLEAVWLLFVSSSVAFFSSVIRGVLGVAGAAVGLFLALALLESVPGVLSWMPTRLAESASDLIGQPTGHIWHAVVIATAASLLGLAVAVIRLGKREVPGSR
jgi:ABC-2 type transport system permease protein